jgi:integrase
MMRSDALLCVPAFIAQLRECNVVAAMALEFCILTATRSGEVYGARWSEIDVEAKVWTLPAARMKAAREHRIPLSARALTILEDATPRLASDYVFPSPRGRKPLSHVSMAKVMRRLQIDGPTVHGFRSAFRDWAGNETH